MDFVLSALFLFACVSMIYTVYKIIEGLFDLSYRRETKKRNARPYTPFEHEVRRMIHSISEAAETKLNWKVVTKRDKHGNECNTIQSVDDKIKVHYPSEYRYLEIEIENLGRFPTDEIRPALRQELSEACIQFRQAVAIDVIKQQSGLSTTRRTPLTAVEN